jgi:spore germination protein GerM
VFRLVWEVSAGPNPAKGEFMKRLMLMTISAGVFFACTLTATTALPSAATPTATQIPPVHFETNSVPADTTVPTNVPETTPPPEVDVLVYFTMADDVEMTPVPVARTIPNSDNFAVLVRATMEQLLQGPTDAEKAQGLISWFSAATAHSLTSVGSYNDVLDMDFAGWKTIIPNASTSAGSQMLLSQLNSTLFQFPSVQRVDYTLDGDCAAFWEWLQSDCHSVTRADWENG